MFGVYLLTAYLFIQCTCEDRSYTNKYDGVDLEEILGNNRLLTAYVNCLLDSGPCTADARELRKNLPEAIENECNKCTERQREGSDQVMHYIIDHRPDDWIKLEEKYNEDGSYKRRYLATKTTIEEVKSNEIENKTSTEEEKKSD